jgi:protein-tyrosine phosphatase
LGKQGNEEFSMTEQTQSMTPERVFKLEGVVNLRDLGGYATADGHSTRWRQLLRGDSLHALTPASLDALLATGLHTVIDMRRPDEIELQPDRVVGLSQIDYQRITILEAAISSPSATEVQHIQGLEGAYRLMLDDYQDRFKEIFATIAAAPAGPVLFHCAAGKDRTGIVSVLLLEFAGVPEATILEDYAMTSVLLAPLLPAFRERARIMGLNPERHEKMLECRPEAMATTLAYLRDQYGGATGYFTKIGLSPIQIDRIRTRLIE